MRLHGNEQDGMIHSLWIFVMVSFKSTSAARLSNSICGSDKSADPRRLVARARCEGFEGNYDRRREPWLPAQST